MTQSIKDNVAGGVEKAGEMAKNKTGGKYDDKIDSGVRKAKDMLR
ncbi:MAG: antitoxin [Catenulispora sp.]|nr:antitoxin [Catenulispora sp.]